VPAHHGVDLGGGSQRAREKAAASHPQEGAGGGEPWEPPVVATAAVQDVGVEGLRAALDDHFTYLERTGTLAARRTRRLEQRTRDVVERSLRRWVFSPAGPRAAVEAALADVAAGRRSPYEAAADVVDRIKGGDGA
jgi:LAO/AO transport system kinase